MAYDDPIQLPQGSPKVSEIAVDREQQVLDTPEHATALVVMEQLRRIATDALSRINYVLHSDGRIRWDGGTLHFDSDSRVNTAIFKIFQTVEGAPRTINFNLVGDLTANTSNTFKNIVLDDRELLYLEIHRDVILNNTTGEVQVENGIPIGDGGGGSLVEGYTLRKEPISSTEGIPALQAKLDGTGTTLNIPLCMRWDWDDGALSYQDIWWIPHGIRWPEDVNATLGAVIARGIEFYPTTFVHTAPELVQAIIDTTNIGGVICVVEPINLDQSVTIPTGVTLLGRSNRTTNPQSKSAISFLPGGRIDMAAGSKIKDISFFSSVDFGASPGPTEWMIEMNGGSGIIENCAFSGANTTGLSYGIRVSSDNNQIKNCKFLTFGTRYGIWYQSGDNNVDRNSEFDNPDYDRLKSATGRDVSWFEDSKLMYMMPPVGSIIAYHGGSHAGTDNGTFTMRMAASNDRADVNTLLDPFWRVCDGTEYNDPKSPIFNVAGRYLPNLTDTRFIAGSTVAGSPGGSNTVTLSTAHLPAHSHVASHNHPNTTPTTGDEDSHTHGPGSGGTQFKATHAHAAFDSANSLYTVSGVRTTTATPGGTNVPKTGYHSHGQIAYNNSPTTPGGTGRPAATNEIGSYYTDSATMAVAHEHWVSGITASASPVVTGTSSAGSAHSHTVTVSTPTRTMSTQNTGSDSPHENKPNYLSVFYIMRVR